MLFLLGGRKRGAAKVLLRLLPLMAFFGLRRLFPVSFLFKKILRPMPVYVCFLLVITLIFSIFMV